VIWVRKQNADGLFDIQEKKLEAPRNEEGKLPAESRLLCVEFRMRIQPHHVAVVNVDIIKKLVGARVMGNIVLVNP